MGFCTPSCIRCAVRSGCWRGGYISSFPLLRRRKRSCFWRPCPIVCAAAGTRYGLAADEVMAFGDGENDLSMIELAGTGVAMGNGEACVKAAADYVTADVHEDGVSRALRHFGLLPGNMTV